MNKNNPIILSIETATKQCSVALSQGSTLLACQELAEEQYTHAEKLHDFISQVIAGASLTFADLDAVAVSKGPGSYTGLRIGVSAAKGLCYALGIPLLAHNTLEVLAQQIQPKNGLVIPMIDARRMEVFTCVFDQEKKYVEMPNAKIIEPDSFSEYRDQLHLVGDGALKCQEVLVDAKFVYYPNNIHPSAKDMIALNLSKYNEQNFEDVAYFEPYYLKDFQVNSKK